MNLRGPSLFQVIDPSLFQVIDPSLFQVIGPSLFQVIDQKGWTLFTSQRPSCFSRLIFTRLPLATASGDSEDVVI